MEVDIYMKTDRIREIISLGESITVEFKQSRNKLNKDVFESVCAFLNRNGGNLFLGVEDKGSIVGIDDNSIDNTTLKDHLMQPV